MGVWEKFKALNIERQQEEVRQVRKSLNVNEEYVSALRTKSYTDFLTKMRLQVRSSSSKSPSFGDLNSQILLEPCQEIIPNIIESTKVLSKYPYIKTLMLKYFDISAEASNICTKILESIIQIQFNYKFLRQAIEAGDSYNNRCSKQRGLNLSELKAFCNATNPLLCLVRNNFKLVQEEYSTVLHNLRSKRKKVVRKVKLRKWFKKACKVCVTTTCSLAAHTLTFILMGPAALSFPYKAFSKKALKFKILRSKTLRKVGEQLDVAAKGTYILDRDFDMISRTILRLHDEIEHDKDIIRFCLKRRNNKFSVREVVKELKKSDMWFRKQLDDLEKHVCLCLVTINRSRALVIKEMSTSCVQDS
ncbi:hypothetical protein QQ045_013953 [Rhodiola kirilowii]